jgi:hypothetical protein
VLTRDGNVFVHEFFEFDHNEEFRNKQDILITRNEFERQTKLSVNDIVSSVKSQLHILHPKIAYEKDVDVVMLLRKAVTSKVRNKVLEKNRLILNHEGDLTRYVIAFPDALTDELFYELLTVRNHSDEEFQKAVWVETAYQLARYIPKVIKRQDWKKTIEKILASNTVAAYNYAFNVLKGPFPAGEATFATDPLYAFYYATGPLKKTRFPAGEPAIATEASLSYAYAQNVIRGPFPAGELAIAKDREFGFRYAELIDDHDPASWGERFLAQYYRKTHNKQTNP